MKKILADLDIKTLETTLEESKKNGSNRLI